MEHPFLVNGQKCISAYLKTSFAGDATFSASAHFSNDNVSFSVEDRSSDADVLRFGVPASARRASPSVSGRFPLAGQNF